MHARSYFIAVPLVTLVYLFALAWLILYDPHHYALLALVIQYGLVLPVLVVCAWRVAGPPAPAGKIPGSQAWPSGAAPGRRHIILALAAYTVLAMALGRYWNGGISLPDEAGYQFIARTFLSGHVAAPALPPTSPDPVIAANERFFDFFIIHDGKWFPQYSPGWPAILALGIALHAGWLVNPVLGLLLLWLMWKLAREFFDIHVARLAIILAILSPFFIAYIIGMLSHVACACAITGALLCCVRASRCWRWQPAALMALLIAAAYLIRPMTAVACGSVLAAALLWSLRRNPRALSISAALLAVCSGAAAAVTLLYNHTCAGLYTLSLYPVFAQIARTSPKELVDFSPLRLVENILWRIRWYGQAILLHNEPFLLLLAGAGWKIGDRRDDSDPAARQIWILPAMLLALVAAHLPTTFTSGSFVGERYYYEAFPGVFVLAARGWQVLAARLRLSRPMVHTLAALLLVVQVVHFALFLPPEVNVARQYREVARFLDRTRPRDAVVFFQTTGSFVATQFNINTPAWKNAEAVYLPDPGPARRDAVAGALGRSSWLVVTYDHGPRVVSTLPPAARSEPPVSAPPRSATESLHSKSAPRTSPQPPGSS